jgi:hypothetical protein
MITIANTAMRPDKVPAMIATVLDRPVDSLGMSLGPISVGEAIMSTMFVVGLGSEPGSGVGISVWVCSTRITVLAHPSPYFDFGLV